MTVLTASAPASEALYAVLQDATLQAAVGGRLYEDVPPDPDFPFVWFEIAHEEDKRGFGTGGLPELEIRTHVFSKFEGKTEAQNVNTLIVGLMKDAAIQVAGYQQCGLLVYRETLAFPDEELNGVKVSEIVSLFSAWYEQG